MVLEVAARCLAVERRGIKYLQIGTASRTQQFHCTETAILRRIGIPALGVHRDLAPLDIGRRAEAAAVRHFKHSRTCRNALREIEVVLLEVLRCPDHNARGVDIERIARDIVCLIAAVDSYAREIEPRRHGILTVAEVDNIVDCFTIACCVAAVDIRPAALCERTA